MTVGVGNGGGVATTGGWSNTTGGGATTAGGAKTTTGENRRITTTGAPNAGKNRCGTLTATMLVGATRNLGPGRVITTPDDATATLLWGATTTTRPR